jgi:hypothetical protein
VAQKLTPAQQRKLDMLRQYQAVVDHVKKLVTELDGNRAARAMVIDNICSTIARELSQLRQRAMSNPVGTLGDTAGALAVLAGRGGSGIALKIRALTDGVNTMSMQLDVALKAALVPEKEKGAEPG